MNISTLIQEAESILSPIFFDIDQRVKQNLKKTLNSFHYYHLGTHHFSSVTGYGHNDSGREVLDKVVAKILGAESAIVRIQFVSGTHAIASALFGVLRPGDEMVSVTGKPYDTLEEVIGLRGNHQGSLKDFHIKYRQLELTNKGTIDWNNLKMAINLSTKLVFIQRSCGYSWRPSLSISDIKKIVQIVKKQNPHVICFVDNCYGEFAEELEPTEVGIDLMAGSLIKNLGGTIVNSGGYVAGNKKLVEMAACRLTSPGIGSMGGATLNQNRLLFQGLFLAPQMVGESIKGSHLLAYIFDKLGYEVNPLPMSTRRDTIQAIKLGSVEKLITFCRAMQSYSPVGSYLDPIPSQMSGYEDQLIMAGGTFIDGSTSELSADGPLREPYIVFCQGGTHWTHISLILEKIIKEIELCS